MKHWMTRQLSKICNLCFTNNIKGNENADMEKKNKKRQI